MSSINSKSLCEHTHEGAIANHINPYQQLKRSIMCCLLWEDNFYEDGKSITARIAELIPLVDSTDLVSLCHEAKEKNKLRHIPLFMIREMAKHDKHKKNVANLLAELINRADELTEFLAIYWIDGKCPISSQVKKGLAKAFNKFNEYELAKYNRDNRIKLRDVLFMVHAKPVNDEQDALWKRLINNELKTPDTWEVALSGGEDKKTAFTRLLNENKLGALAFLRNLRNMFESKVDVHLIKKYLSNLKVDKILPFRFISASKHAPQLEPELEIKMIQSLSNHNKLKGQTVLLVDVSGSMDNALSSKSEVSRMDTACALAILLREVCEQISIYSFSDLCKIIPSRHGFALRDAIISSQSHSGTALGSAILNIALGSAILNIGVLKSFDRLIVITDEQSRDNINENLLPTKSYCINIATNKNGISYDKKWHHIDGWSEGVVNYIMEIDNVN
jgi:60 kDa SS-A/Ro ribonucleoprotein